MLAGFAAEHRLATIISTKTAGNVLGAANFKVGAGYWVRLPVFGWYTSKGDCLEGKRVVPDILAEVDPRSLNSGTDQQMGKALEILGGLDKSNTLENRRCALKPFLCSARRSRPHWLSRSAQPNSKTSERQRGNL